tara:strand:+ start:266 stop:1459 length:1194 start_codon:yes stop_codon:yes gene_type:complete
MTLEKNIKTKDEIDLIELLSTILNNKWTIFLTTIAAVVLMYIYQISQQSKFATTISAKTEIRPISVYYESGFEAFNSYVENNSLFNNDDQQEWQNQASRFVRIDADYLLKLFIVKFNDYEFIRDQLKKFNYIEKKNFENAIEYENMLTQLAYSIRILSPDKKIGQRYTLIKFRTNDLERWMNFLKYIERPINQKIQLHLKNDFNKKIESLKRINQFKIEDIKLKLEEELVDYKVEVLRKLVFLNEQAQIARTLNIAKNNPIPIVDYTSNTGSLTNSLTKIPYYMRGYEMIEKEIELIKKRTNEKPFNKLTIDLEREKKRLIANKKIERLQNQFDMTPVVKKEKFHSARIIVNSTTVKIDKNDKIIRLFLAGMLALIVSSLYVLMVNALRNRKSILNS